MRIFLLLTLMPFLSMAQRDTAFTYHVKMIHAQTLKSDGSLLWKIDTIKYSVPFEIKINQATGKIIIDGYGMYKIIKQEMHGDEVGHYPYYEFSNGTKFTWIENAMLWEYPMINGKAKLIIFEID